MIPPGLIAAGGGVVFTPESVTGLIYWLDVDNGITLNGADVSNWEAVNDTAIDFGQATAADQPTYTGITINSKQALGFPGSSEFLREPSVAINVGSGDFYVGMVLQFDTLSGFIPLLTNSQGADNFVLGYDAGAGEIQMYFGVDPAPAFPSISVSTATPYVLEVWRDGTSVRARLNGTIDTNTQTSSTAAANTDEQRLGDNGFGDMFDGKMGDVVFYTSLPSASERTSLKQFFADKFGITVS